MKYIHPLPGAVYLGAKGCRFTLWAPLKKKVLLVLGLQEHLMHRDEQGYWTIEMNDARPGDRYAFKADDGTALPDPASRCQPDGVHGLSCIIDNHFSWTDDEWRGLPLNEMVIYEIHVGAFTEQGTFEGIISKLPYLRSLGINTIELMPVFSFPGSRNWGYDLVYPYSVHTVYGGHEGLKKLVDAAHSHGIAVLMDVVYNHLGPEGNYFEQYGPYTTEKYKTPWGKAINFDDAYCDAVRSYYWYNALMWLDEFHVDGLRLDAVHAIWDNSANPFIAALQTKVSDLEKATGRKKILIAEFDLNNPKIIAPPETGGSGLAGQWNDEFHHALHAVITGETNGYYEDFGSVELLAKAFRDCYVFTGEYSSHRKKNFGALPHPSLDYSRFVVFGQNHDQIGNRRLGDRLATQLSSDQLKLVAATVLLSPFVPLLYMGEEYGETNPFPFFADYGDPALRKAVVKSRKDEFAHFKDEREAPDPCDVATFESARLQWNIEQDERKKMLFEYYRWLIAFRNSNPAMRATARNAVEVFHTSGESIIGLKRKSEKDELLIILHFSGHPAAYHHPIHQPMRQCFDSNAPQWHGTGQQAPAHIQPGVPFNVDGFSVTIYQPIS
ncbi:MAG: malto-oligosyltrehalose trehalohydrolase [Agriterribacter sp.]